jgi:hypothetical protein
MERSRYKVLVGTPEGEDQGIKRSIRLKRI